MVVRTRIAPSPTGQDLHVGNIYTGLLNYAYAKKHNGQFIIRVEDTDRERYVEGSEERILTSLKKFGLNYDEGPDIGGNFAPYRQSERLEIYTNYAKELISKGHAYYCFCTKERLDELRKKQTENGEKTRYDRFCLNNVEDSDTRIKNGEKHVVRLKVPDDEKIKFNDLIRGEIVIDSIELDDQVLLKSDGFPTYHLGVVIDDHLMEISHIIRAEEWISSTPKHVLLYRYFGWEEPVFAHLPLLRNSDHSKLSKRKNPVWASWYIENGYLPEAMINFLALLGWSHPEEKEIFSLDEFIKFFDLKDVHPAGPIFDLTKLEWMNGVYIREVLTEDDLKERLFIFYRNDVKVSHYIENSRILNLAKTRMNTLLEFKNLVVKSENAATPNEILKQDLKIELEKISKDEWHANKIFSVFKNLAEKHKIKMPAIYEIFTGKKQGLPLPDFLEAIGRDESFNRI
ncbi:MAG TPA: glutamate--tRNA ligase [Patescibacteria group bacterium]|nr:glutamate--tRNA ligase [Patescibacteria group bacterium]